MGKRKNPWITIGYSNYEGFQLMPFDWRTRGETHELNRQRVVSSILLELYIMATVGIIPKDRIVRVQQSISRNLRGGRRETSKPAACCPRQVEIGDKTPTELLQKAFPERAFEVNAFFAQTDLLPANYNRADTRADGNGLGNGFVTACRFVVDDANYHGKLIHLNAANAVRRAYSIYKDHALDAYRVTCERLEDKLRFNIAKTDAQNWNEQLQIIKIYKTTLNRSSGASVVLDIERVTGLIRRYRNALNITG